MTEPEYSTTLQDKCGSTESLSGIVEQIELRLAREVDVGPRIRRVGCNMFNGEGDLSNVVFDEQLSSSIGSIEQAWGGDIAQVPYEA